MNVIRAVLGWLLPVLILGAAVAAFMFLGSQKPPPRREAAAPTAVAVQTTQAPATAAFPRADHSHRSLDVAQVAANASFASSRGRVL